MILQEIIDDIHVLTDDVRVYERKYGILSETFYEIYSSGTEPENDDWVLDWSDWAGAYKILLRRQKQYYHEIQEFKKQEQSLMNFFNKAARHEPISVVS